MLKSIHDLDEIKDGEWLYCIMHHWIAMDPESGAHLTKSNGRRKMGRDTNYVLILPDRTPEERGGLWTHYEFDPKTGRKRIHAASESEAIQAAQIQLQKMLERRIIEAS